MDASRLNDLDTAGRVRELARVVISLALAGGALLTAYYLSPFSTRGVITVLAYLVVAPALYLAAVSRQLRKVVVASVPQLRAVQSAVVSVLLFQILFAGGYLALGSASEQNFSEPLDHTRALYFAITVLSTVGLGDIPPESDVASIVVSVQMLLDLVVLGFIVKAFVRAAQAGLGSGRPPDS